MRNHIIEARDLVVPTDVNEGLLYTLDELVDAVRLENEREFEDALQCYRNVSSSEVQLRKRETLIDIKQHLVTGSENAALEKAEGVFGSGSPVLTAVQLVAGDSVSSPLIKPPVLVGLSGVNPKTRWRFAMLAYLASSIEESDMALTAEIREAILDL